MDLEQRVAELERRLDALESGEPAARAGDGDFWALEGLRAQLADVEGGGVLFTGSVLLPTEERYEWQYGMTTDQLLEADWSEAADVFAALGHPMRLRLLREIVGGRRTATELAGLDDVGTSGQIYHHLRQLTAAGWLRQAGRGRYEIPGSRVVPLLVALTTAQPV
ncbi:DNA-binding transcriptional ArsR family regulator [Streptomyces umbrinus]|uniref:DNA-binding transcriptional ArsR family regulator n=1 Tax=Streptomyces umbrinus TaxID=67370 RepID=A0ABU0SVL5_9ACTN|nr:helix-turn-helix domain-containing protein [Streptomyces umbrinus]MDQ1027537.1 DNA-binding transcriptional ArsR family regulator [Streptomyces umbrinus]